MIKVAVSGYFDCIHYAHCEYMRLAKELGDYLVVFVDGDNRAIVKKGYVFMPEEQRAAIIRDLKYVDEVIIVHDSIDKVLERYPVEIFAKGGDRDITNIPKAELDICEKLGIKIVCGLGEKKQSSTFLVQNYYNNINKLKENQNE